MLQNRDLPENVPMQKIEVNTSENIPFTLVKDTIYLRKGYLKKGFSYPRRTNVDYGTRFQMLLPP